MMADLIRTSMFCDVNNFIIEGDQQYSGDDLYDTCSVNFVEFMTRTSDNFDDVSMDTDVFVEQEQQQLCQQTTPQNDVTDNTCKVSVATPEICQDFLSRIAEASKVDYSTFNNEAPSDVFCNNYLLPVVAQKQTILEQIPTCESKPEASAKFARPPYSYAACAVAAMYLIGNSSACANDILDKICSVFDDMKACNRQQFRKQLCKTLRTNKMFEQVKQGIFRVVPGCVDKNVFHRQPCVDSKRKDKYADTIQEHLKIPFMLEHFGIEQVRKEKAPRKRRRIVVSELLKYRSSNGKSQVQSVNIEDELTKDLRMPHRPCFNDDSDNENNELFTPVPRHNISPVSEDFVHTSVNICSDDSIYNSEQTMNNVQMPLCASYTAVQQTPPVVVPVPRYAVPNPSSCVPLRCQEYHVPFVGTFHLVDMYYNGQIIHQLYP